MISRYHNPIGPEFSLINKDQEMRFLGYKKKPLLLGLIGPTKSGKTLIAKYLVTEFDFRYECLSIPLRILSNNIEAKDDWESLSKFGVLVRKYESKDYLAIKVFEKIKNYWDENLFVVDGIFHPMEIEYLKRASNFVLWGLKTDQQLRIDNATKWFGKDMKEDIKKRDQYENLNCLPKNDYLPNLFRCYELCDEFIEVENFDYQNLCIKIKDKVRFLINHS